jgi:hypothetical protein
MDHELFRTIAGGMVFLHQTVGQGAGKARSLALALNNQCR